MDEYIRKEDIYRVLCHDYALNGYEQAYCSELIRKIPAADVVERKHGKWIENVDNAWWEDSETRFCSCCGQGINIECVPWFKFCHNCGAKMDAED